MFWGVAMKLQTLLCATSAVLVAMAFIAPRVVAQTRADNRAACQNADAQIAIAGCSRDIESGEEKTAADLAIAYYDRAMAYDSEGRSEMAISDYTKAIELNPDDSNYYDNRGADYFDSGRVNDAIADFRTALKVNPNDPIATKSLATAAASTTATAPY
jgi:tetratricopeptide (TPR) repeat protein